VSCLDSTEENCSLHISCQCLGWREIRSNIWPNQVSI
jgi:hypothetical protein